MMVIALGLPFSAFGQGGRAGRAGAQQGAPQPTQQSAQQPAAQPAAPAPTATPQTGAAGRGGRGGAGGGTSEFYDYDTAAATSATIPDASPKESHQKISINGEALAYTVLAGYLPLRNATTGQSEAHLFYTYYAKDGVTDASGRPILFFLGGGPGVAAAWQELGGMGPKRIKLASDGSAGLPPYTWVDNPNTLLGQADLVFVNPVGTAFSRPDQPSRGPTFWSAAGDAASLGDFVRSFLNANNRRNSPLILAGEDFGTGRAAGLAAYLQEHNIPVCGVALLSMTLSADSTAGDAQYMTLLPSLTMAAWYHKKLAPELNAMSAEQVANQARQFASREYLHALYKGDRMTPDERAKALAGLARLTGLSQAFIANNNLRITLDRFNAELMRDQHRGLSNSDARVDGFTPGAGGGRGGGGGFGAAAALDFRLSNLAGPFQTAYEAYLRGDLGFTGTGVFYLSGGGVGAFSSTGSDDTSLAAVFARNPDLRVFVALNYYDLHAPFDAAEFTLAHVNVAPEARAHNIAVSHYEAGQMPYADEKALAKLHGDLSKFVADATSPRK
jgi:carboxypeptidase C (cathepsin A)